MGVSRTNGRMRQPTGHCKRIGDGQPLGGAAAARAPIYTQAVCPSLLPLFRLTNGLLLCRLAAPAASVRLCVQL